MQVSLKETLALKETIEKVSGNGFWAYQFALDAGRNGVMLVADGKYDVMDGETGFYMGTVEFSILVPVARPEKFRIFIKDTNHKDKYGLHEYFEDTFASVLAEDGFF